MVMSSTPNPTKIKMSLYPSLGDHIGSSLPVALDYQNNKDFLAYVGASSATPMSPGPKRPPHNNASGSSRLHS